MLFRLIGFVLMMELAAALAITTVGGDPFDFDMTWQAIGLLALLIAGALIIGWLVFGALTRDKISPRDALIRAVAATAIVMAMVILLMGVGRDWLTTVFEPFGSSRNWWPVLVLVVSLAGAWLLKPRTPRRVRT